MFKIMWKPYVVRVNLSSTFVMKNKCPFCHKSASEYYWVNLPPYYYDPKSSQEVFNWLKKYIKSITPSHSRYFKMQPRHFKSLKELSVYWSEKSYKAALHQKLNVELTDHVIEYLGCPCGRTLWAFNQKDAEERPEIKNRKARYKYPQKFESF